MAGAEACALTNVSHMTSGTKPRVLWGIRCFSPQPVSLLPHRCGVPQPRSWLWEVLVCCPAEPRFSP